MFHFDYSIVFFLPIVKFWIIELFSDTNRIENVVCSKHKVINVLTFIPEISSPLSKDRLFTHFTSCSALSLVESGCSIKLDYSKQQRNLDSSSNTCRSCGHATYSWSPILFPLIWYSPWISIMMEVIPSQESSSSVIWLDPQQEFDLSCMFLRHHSLFCFSKITHKLLLSQ